LRPEFERAATDRIVALTEGYPYFLQEYGKHVWNVAAAPTITLADVKRAHGLVQLELDESFFRVRIGRATKAELAYLAAMAHLAAGPLPLRRDRRPARPPGPRECRSHPRATDREGPDLQPLLRPERVHRPSVRRLHPAQLSARHTKLNEPVIFRRVPAGH
jgi:hypothetical protein